MIMLNEPLESVLDFSEEQHIYYVNDFCKIIRTQALNNMMPRVSQGLNT